MWGQLYASVWEGVPRTSADTGLSRWAEQPCVNPVREARLTDCSDRQETDDAARTTKAAAWGRPVIVLYLFASLLGALATIIPLASYSWLLAILYAPLGATALTLIVAVAAYVLRGQREPSRTTFVPVSSPETGPSRLLVG